MLTGGGLAHRPRLDVFGQQHASVRRCFSPRVLTRTLSQTQNATRPMQTARTPTHLRPPTSKWLQLSSIPCSPSSEEGRPPANCGWRGGTTQPWWGGRARGTAQLPKARHDFCLLYNRPALAARLRADWLLVSVWHWLVVCATWWQGLLLMAHLGKRITDSRRAVMSPGRQKPFHVLP